VGGRGGKGWGGVLNKIVLGGVVTHSRFTE